VNPVNIILALILLALETSCGSERTGSVAKPASSSQAKTLDTSNAFIRLEAIPQGYRVSVQPKGKTAALQARCLSWSLENLKEARILTSLEVNEDACNDESHPLLGAEAIIHKVSKDRGALAKAYGTDYAATLAAARNPVILLEGIEYQGTQSPFLELAPGEIQANLVFQADDACPNRAGTVEGCEKRALPAPTTGVIRVPLKFKIKENLIEIQ
jgi:hypothetical protein